jgi:hypothetical protein
MSIQAIRFNGRYYIDHAPDPGSDTEACRSDGGMYFAEVEAVLSIVPADPSKYRSESVNSLCTAATDMPFIQGGSSRREPGMPPSNGIPTGICFPSTAPRLTRSPASDMRSSQRHPSCLAWTNSTQRAVSS